MVTKEVVLKALAQCHDPELGLDVVSLGLIYEVLVRHDQITVVMTLTTPGCPLVPYFRQDIEEKIMAATGVKKIEIQLTFDPPWNPERISAAAQRQLTLMRG